MSSRLRIGKVAEVGEQHVHIATFFWEQADTILSRVRTMEREDFMMFMSG
jgi:hypothetical protein